MRVSFLGFNTSTMLNSTGISALMIRRISAWEVKSPVPRWGVPSSTRPLEALKMFGNLPSSSLDVHIAYTASVLANFEGKLGNYDLLNNQTSKTMANENEGSLRMFLKMSAEVAPLAARRNKYCSIGLIFKIMQ
jgi:hypothetical protein